MRWWRRKKKERATDSDQVEEPRRRGRPRNEVKDLRARLVSRGFTIHH
jgi:hypothetical protein